MNNSMEIFDIYFFIRVLFLTCFEIPYCRIVLITLSASILIGFLYLFINLVLFLFTLKNYINEDNSESKSLKEQEFELRKLLELQKFFERNMKRELALVRRGQGDTSMLKAWVDCLLEVNEQISALKAEIAKKKKANQGNNNKYSFSVLNKSHIPYNNA